MADSSEEESPLFAAPEPSKPSRIIRGRPQEPNTQLADDPKLKHFKMTNPGETPERVTAAYLKCSGDVKKAQLLLKDDNFKVNPNPAPPSRPRLSNPSNPSPPNLNPNGTTPERKSKRDAEKEKSKHSTIYAKRAMLGGLSGSVVEPIIVPNSPPSPTLAIRPPPRRKALRVVNSDSDYEVPSDTESIHISQIRPHHHYEEQALRYFNETEIDRLMELCGWYYCTYAGQLLTFSIV